MDCNGYAQPSNSLQMPTNHIQSVDSDESFINTLIRFPSPGYENATAAPTHGTYGQMQTETPTQKTYYQMPTGAQTHGMHHQFPTGAQTQGTYHQTPAWGGYATFSTTGTYEIVTAGTQGMATTGTSEVAASRGAPEAEGSGEGGGGGEGEEEEKEVNDEESGTDDGEDEEDVTKKTKGAKGKGKKEKAVCIPCGASFKEKRYLVSHLRRGNCNKATKGEVRCRICGKAGDGAWVATHLYQDHKEMYSKYFVGLRSGTSSQH